MYRTMLNLVLRTILAIVLSCAGSSAFGWICPGHRDNALLAVQGLDAQTRAEFNQLWQDARKGSEQRPCAQGADSNRGTNPTCIDRAAMSGIADDRD